MAVRFSRLNGLRIGLAAFALPLLPRISHALQTGFTSVGDLSGALFQRDVTGISADGATVVGTNLIADPTGTQLEAFRWTREGGIVGLGDLPGGTSDSVAKGVSGDGSVITGWGTAGFDQRAFRWTAATGMTPIGQLGNSGSSHAWGVSQNGQVIVGDANCEGFRWTAATGMLSIGTVSGASCVFASGGANADGSIIAGTAFSASSLNDNIAFRWTAASGMVSLGDLPGGATNARARGISADGTAVVGLSSSANGTEAFLWREGSGMVGLGDLPGGDFSSEAVGISADGRIVVGSGWNAGGQQAMIWDAAHGMRDLKAVLQNEYGLSIPVGWRLFDAYISADGTAFAGRGINPSGQYAGWYAAVPEPSATLLSMTATSLLLRRRTKCA